MPPAAGRLAAAIVQTREHTLDLLDCGAGRDLLRAGLTDEGVEVVVSGIDAIWRGQALLPQEIAPDRAQLAAEVFRTLADGGRAEIDEEGRLVGVHGFTLHETRHCIVHHGREHHVWCAFDSVGIPAAYGLDAVASTDCPTCGALLTIHIRRGVPAEGPVVLWLPVPDGTSDLMHQFCANADLYCSKAHLEERVDVAKASGSVLTLTEAAGLGRDTWADVSHVDMQ